MAVVASQAAQISGAVRDAAFGVNSAGLVASHGFAHNLYLGLGVVPNRWGITYDDEVALNAAKQAVPGIKDYSTDYFRVIRGLYLDKLREEPLEVARIYSAKLRIFLTTRILDSAPALWIFLPVVLFLQVMALRCEIPNPGPRNFRGAVTFVALLFIAFFALQAVVAHPSRYFAMPIGACILVMTGIAMENLAIIALALMRRFAAGMPRPM